MIKLNFAVLSPDGKEQGTENPFFDNHENVLWIEVTVSWIVKKLTHGNLDHHGPECNFFTPTSVQQALVCDIPSVDALSIVTIRPDADSLAAMAVLSLRVEEAEINEELISEIAAFDKKGFKATDSIPPSVIAISRIAWDRNLSIEQKVEKVKTVFTWEMSSSEINDMVEQRNQELELAADESDIVIRDSGIVCVKSTHRFATNLGYTMGNVVVAYNPKMPIDFRDASKGTYSKFTICRLNSYIPLDIPKILEELNQKETANGSWWWQGDIIWSPQWTDSSLSFETIIEIVERNYVPIDLDKLKWLIDSGLKIDEINNILNTKFTVFMTDESWENLSPHTLDSHHGSSHEVSWKELLEGGDLHHNHFFNASGGAYNFLYINNKLSIEIDRTESLGNFHVHSEDGEDPNQSFIAQMEKLWLSEKDAEELLHTTFKYPIIDQWGDNHWIEKDIPAISALSDEQFTQLPHWQEDAGIYLTSNNPKFVIILSQKGKELRINKKEVIHLT